MGCSSSSSCCRVHPESSQNTTKVVLVMAQYLDAAAPLPDDSNMIPVAPDTPIFMDETATHVDPDDARSLTLLNIEDVEEEFRKMEHKASSMIIRRRVVVPPLNMEPVREYYRKKAARGTS